jgi:Domain of unknown function (DUF1905)
MPETLQCTAPLWRWSGGGNASWYFVTIGGDAGEAIAATALMRRLEGLGSRGFGSIRVTARIGDTTFQTSVFPHQGEGYILPVKAAVRRAESLDEGDAIAVTLAY